jgi:hypothetical protein
MATETITLDTPITRGEQTITTITLIKPKTRGFCGVGLSEILQMNVDALIRILPRMTEPSLTKDDIARMDISDTLQLGMAVVSFLAPKANVQEDCVSE